MAIREATTSVEEPRPSGPRPDRRRRRRDLRAGPFPTAAMDQWHDTGAALTQLSRHAEGRAIEAIDWYLQDKRGKRIWSRGLRLLVILLVTAGGLQPLLDAAAPGPSRTAWGYVLLAQAAACIGFDRFFGVSSGWMRAMTTARPWSAASSSSSTTGPPSAPAAPRAPSTPSRSRTAWPCCACSPTTWPPSCSRRRPSGCSSSRATSCAWSGSAPTAPAPAPGRYHCRAPPSPRRGRRPGADAQRPRTRAGGAAQAARRRQGVPLTWRARNGSWPGCGSRRRRPTCGTSRSVPGG
jgi:SMODS and SLOG-associating 2TM effector domain 2